MVGADEYVDLFGHDQQRQYGRFLIQCGDHVRGSTFHVFLLPKNLEWVVNSGGVQEDLENGIVEIYGITGGNSGWPETYGWLHQGPWQKDFEYLVKRIKEDKEIVEINLKKAEEERKRIQTEERQQKLNKIFAQY